MALTKATYSMIVGAPTNVDDYGAVGDGVTDDTAAIQAAVTAGTLIQFTAGKTYIVSPQALSTPDGGTGICINVGSNKHLRMYGATIKVKSGSSATGAVIGNSATTVTNIVIEGGTVDCNQANVAGNLPTVVLFRATYSTIKNVRTKNNKFIGLGFRANALGSGGNTITGCYVEDCQYIGISCNKQELGVEISGNIVQYTGDNAIDVEGNNPSGAGIGNRILITNNECYSFTHGIFLESVGSAIISNNYLDNFNSSGIALNRINSGALGIVVTGNQITNGSGNGINVANNSGQVIIDSNRFASLINSIYCEGTALNLSVGKNLHSSISATLVKLKQDTNSLVRSRVLSQDYASARSVGKPFTASPLTNTNNYPNRSFNCSFAASFYMDSGTTASNVEDEYKDGVTGSLAQNSSWSNAYSIYSGGETLVYSPSTAMNVGFYVKLNGVLFYVYAYVGSVFTLRSAAGVAGDYTATTNGAYAWVEYYPEWQTT